MAEKGVMMMMMMMCHMCTMESWRNEEENVKGFKCVWLLLLATTPVQR